MVKDLKGHLFCHPRIHLFVRVIILHWLLFRNCKHKRNSENPLEVGLLYEIYLCKGNLHL